MDAYNVLADMDKYAIYLRKSRADMEAEKLGEGETLARHKKILTELAARKGLYIEKIYQEIVSGETIEARPEIQKLIADCYAGKYKGIIIVEVTRLSRGNQGDAQKIMDCLKYSNMNSGVLVITPTKVYDVVNSQEDEEYMEFELFMSRREYKMIRKRMDRGKKQAVVEGNYMATFRPYGYDIIKTKTGRTLTINESEAKIVKLIFELRHREELTYWQIAKRLTSMGIPTYSGITEWTKETIKSMLRNPVYIGKVQWNTRMTIKRMIDGKLISSLSSNRGDHYMLYDGKHPAIIDEKVFHEVGKKYRSDKTKGTSKLKSPLAGLLVCEKCKHAMVYKDFAHHNNRKSRYVHRMSDSCKVKSVVVTDILNALIHALKLYIGDFEVKIDNLPDTNENIIDSQLEALRKELVRTERKLSKLFDAWEDDDITNNEFIQRKLVNKEKIKSIKKQINELEDALPEKEEFEESILRLSDALDALLDDSLEADIKNKYLKQIIERIEYGRENNEEFIIDVTLY